MIRAKQPATSASGASALAGKGRAARCPVKTPDVYSDEQLQMVARLYYCEQMEQRTLANLLNISQAKISRMLAVARERGIVRFFVEENDPRHRELEQRILRKFKLNSVAVIKTPEGSTADAKRWFVAHFGSPFITSLISPQSDVAVAGGRTIGELVQRLPEDHQRHVTVLQALGVMNSALTHVDALELGGTLARRWGGFFMALNTPAIVPDRQTRDYLLQRSHIRSVWKRLERANAAIVAVGTPTNSVFANRFVASADDLAALAKRGAVGEMCGRFFDRQGRECDSPWRDQVISMELEQLRSLPQVVALVVGRDRSAAVAAAIRGGLLKSLVIDVEGARALLEN